MSKLVVLVLSLFFSQTSGDHGGVALASTFTDALLSRATDTGAADNATSPFVTSVGVASSTSCLDIRYCRDIWSIVWSCLTVILACTWAALHRDIPPKNVHWIIVFANRIWTTIVAFFTPEFMAFMAIMEFDEARRVKKMFKGLLPQNFFFVESLVDRRSSCYIDLEWSQTHAFFAIMGGFMLVEPVGEKGYRELGVVYPAKLRSLYDAGRIDLRLITKATIQDKSKGDWVSKGIVLLQTTWFIIQILARLAERLPVTELEIVTLAFTVLNFLTYGFWGNKPIGVQTPIALPLLPPKPSSPVRSTDQSQDKDSEKGEEGDGDASAAVTSIVLELERQREDEREARLENPTPTEVFRDLLSLLYKYSPQLFRDPVGCVRVVIMNLSRSGAPTGICLSLTVITTIFGGIHLIAWNFRFPTLEERWAWRAAAIVISVVPAYMFFGRTLAVYLIDSVLKVKREGIMRRILLGVATLLCTLPGGVLYTLSRAALILVAVMELRNLPAGALVTVQWTTLIPHV